MGVEIKVEHKQSLEIFLIGTIYTNMEIYS